MYTFPLEPNEKILKKDHASLSVDGDAYTGALYLTTDRVVFVGYILDINSKYIEEILYQHIRTVGKEKSFFVLANVLVLETIRDRTLKFVVNERDSWYQTLSEQLAQL